VGYHVLSVRALQSRTKCQLAVVHTFTLPPTINTTNTTNNATSAAAAIFNNGQCSCTLLVLFKQGGVGLHACKKTTVPRRVLIPSTLPKLTWRHVSAQACPDRRSSSKS